MAKIVAAISETNKTITAKSVKEMAEKLGTSRTNVSDVVNERAGRVSVRDKNGKTWYVA